MNFLLLVAHGSRRPESNAEIAQLACQLRTQGQCFDRIDYAFLELAEPSIQEALLRQINDGARRIVVMPYFLSAGRHVAEDIPAQVQMVRQRYPQLEIIIAPYLGAAASIAGLLLELTEPFCASKNQ